jgi:hypothetical protein
MGLCWLLPFQEKTLKTKQAEEQKTYWSIAQNKCSKATPSFITASRDSSGSIYCISSSGRITATITGERR